MPLTEVGAGSTALSPRIINRFLMPASRPEEVEAAVTITGQRRGNVIDNDVASGDNVTPQKDAAKFVSDRIVLNVPLDRLQRAQSDLKSATPATGERERARHAGLTCR